MDISKLPPDTIVTDEMLNPVEGIFLLVISNHEKVYEAIRYMGNSEVEAYKIYKKIRHNDKIIVKATVTYSDLFKEMYGTEFIIDYKIIEFLKKGV